MARRKQPPKRRRPPRRRRKLRLLLPAVAAAIVVGLVLAAGLRSDDDDSGSAPLRPHDPGLIHVHGLGVDPLDGAVLIATHSGTYRVARGETTAKRIGNSRQDTMGFTVVGPGRFLGSGHPDPKDAGEGAPDLLGLIESIDGGRTWHAVSLRGEADLHVLRARGRRVYAYDVAGNRLLVSRNGGRTWLPRSSPGDPLLDIAIDPENPKHAIAETTRTLYRSHDEARSWKRVGLRIGYLAWPLRRRLFLVDVLGRVFLSRDAGRTWRQVGEIGDAPASFVARSSRELFVALRDGTVMRSRNGGRTWSIRSTAGA